MSARVEASQRIDGVYVVRFERFADARGSFHETYRRRWIPGAGEMVQGNCSLSRAGVLRGMHYHLKQADFWSVPSGRVRTALYDFRASSRTRGASQMLDMGAAEPMGLYIPRGVAHGFLALDESIMSYLVDVEYDGDDELGIRWNDPALHLDWAIATAPVLSERDHANPRIEDIPPGRRPA